jgi:hypothetical protein
MVKITIKTNVKLCKIMVKNVPDHHRHRRLSNPTLPRRIHVYNSNSGN